MIGRWRILLQGFLQDLGEPTGMVRLWAEMQSTIAAPDTAVLLHPWSVDVNQLAEFVWRASEPTADVVIAGYSWGGQTAANLCRQLQRRGRTVRDLVLSDPVYRHWWLPRRWTSLVPGLAIEIPANVQRVQSFVQRQSRPYGHDVVCVGADTVCEYPVTLPLDHIYMDDAQQFHRAVMEVSR